MGFYLDTAKELPLVDASAPKLTHVSLNRAHHFSVKFSDPGLVGRIFSLHVKRSSTKITGFTITEETPAFSSKIHSKLSRVRPAGWLIFTRTDLRHLEHFSSTNLPTRVSGTRQTPESPLVYDCTFPEDMSFDPLYYRPEDDGWTGATPAPAKEATLMSDDTATTWWPAITHASLSYGNYFAVKFSDNSLDGKYFTCEIVTERVDDDRRPIRRRIKGFVIRHSVVSEPNRNKVDKFWVRFQNTRELSGIDRFSMTHLPELVLAEHENGGTFYRYEFPANMHYRPPYNRPALNSVQTAPTISVIPPNANRSSFGLSSDNLQTLFEVKYPKVETPPLTDAELKYPIKLPPGETLTAKILSSTVIKTPAVQSREDVRAIAENIGQRIKQARDALNQAYIDAGDLETKHPFISFNLRGGFRETYEP